MTALSLAVFVGRLNTVCMNETMYRCVVERWATNANDAAQHTDLGNGDRNRRPEWISVLTWNVTAIEAGQVIIPQRVWVLRNPVEPPCRIDRRGHNYQPLDMSHAGSFVISHVCLHCTDYRRTNTRTRDPSGAPSDSCEITYSYGDDSSRRWVDAQVLQYQPPRSPWSSKERKPASQS